MLMLSIGKPKKYGRKNFSFHISNQISYAILYVPITWRLIRM